MKAMKKQYEKKLEILKKRLSKVREIGKFSLKMGTDLDKNKKEEEYLGIYVCPSDFAYEEMDGVKGDGVTDVAVYLDLSQMIERKCRLLGRIKKISRIIMIDDPEDECFGA